MLLADEPIASLDPASARRVMDTLAAICREDGITVLVSLHQVEYARRFCPRTIAMREGRIVYDGPSTALSKMILTVQIAVWGTALAVLFSIPFGILSSSNMVPWYVCQPVRRLMDAFRAINEIVFAVLFVVAVGLGPFAGVMALFVHTTGILAKLFSEAVEAIDPRPVEGIRATGASKVQEIVYGVVPQVLPLWTSFSLYRFESNVRAATVLGLVGAGGIGQVLFESIRGFYYAETAALLIIIVVTVTIVDLASQQLRRMVT